MIADIGILDGTTTSVECPDFDDVKIDGGLLERLYPVLLMEASPKSLNSRVKLNCRFSIWSMKLWLDVSLWT